MFTPAQRDEMLDLAVGAIRAALVSGEVRLPSVGSLPAYLREPGCSFVTLRRDGQLLGCIGALEPYQPLGHDIVEHAIAAAFRDPRFEPITDLSGVHVEISVLGPLREFPAESYDDVVARLPRVGAVVSGFGRRGTFLPAVWEQLPTNETFVSGLWRKAGLQPGQWPVEIWTYEVEEFGRVVAPE
ncbi:MAG TPA: AmmeMemoRadiSam system protein A [Actinomycetota bacterium]|nr:AmmeMemoRadiSam system protein A [Actinomycetota bacterium]